MLGSNWISSCMSPRARYSIVEGGNHVGRHCSLPTAAATAACRQPPSLYFILLTAAVTNRCWPRPSVQHCSVSTTTAITTACRPPLQLADSRRHYSPSISVANIANRQPPPLLQVQFPPLFGSASAGGIGGGTNSRFVGPASNIFFPTTRLLVFW